MKKKVKAQEMYAEMDENIYGGCREENGNTRTMGMDITRQCIEKTHSSRLF